MEGVADVATDEKRRMLFESLGFVPDGDELDLFEGKRPDLRIGDLKSYGGTAVELVVRVVDARQRVKYGADVGSGKGRPKYFYLFEDETGLLEGIGENRCVTYGTPPVCFLRGEIRIDGEGVPKVFNCVFLKGF
jgi:DNA polymerase-3 subunit alpha/error-prone DNA polymerase